MKPNTTSSSRVRGRSNPSDPFYDHCPLCGSAEIKLGPEVLTISAPDGKKVKVRVRRWSCANCQEKFLTRDSRRKLDIAMGLESAVK